VHEVISVKVVQLKDLFSDAYEFRLPYFQRAYAWQTAEIGRLLSDITQAMRASQGKRGYFLGKLMVAKKQAQPETALVDGHQRVMSLTLLFAVLRDLESDPALQIKLNDFIRGKDVRLKPQEAMALSCERFVQTPGATAVEPDEDLELLSETERNVIENRNYLRAELSSADYPPEVRHTLITYLSERCCVIVASVEDEEEAWSFLRTEEETRVDFSKSDRAKFSLIAIVPPNERAACQKVWESCEALLGAADMHALLGHLRTLKRRRNSGKPIEIEIAEGYKFNSAGAGLAFLEKQLKPAAEKLAVLRRTGDGRNGAQLPSLSERLTWIDPQLWVPAALLWLEHNRDPDETLTFFKKLERLVWMMKIAGFDPTKQSNRIIQLLGEIERTGSPAKMRELDITNALRDAATSNLRSPTFDAKHYSGRVLRRVSLALGQDPGPIERTTLTIEHVLPRGFSPKSGWRTHFPSARSVRDYSHRLGNLTLLSPGDNQKADVLDWVDKRPILAGSQYVLSRRLAEAEAWTPARILERTEEMIAILFKDWEIKV
jgi:hypothetical protein